MSDNGKNSASGDLKDLPLPGVLAAAEPLHAYLPGEAADASEEHWVRVRTVNSREQGRSVCSLDWSPGITLAELLMCAATYAEGLVRVLLSIEALPGLKERDPWVSVRREQLARIARELAQMTGIESHTMTWRDGVEVAEPEA